MVDARWPWSKLLRWSRSFAVAAHPWPRLTRREATIFNKNAIKTYHQLPIIHKFRRWVIFCLPVSGKIARVTVPFATQPMTPWNSGAHRGVMAVDTAKYSTYCHWMSWRHFHFCKDEKRHQTNLTSLNITRHSTVLGCMVQVKSCPNLSNEVSLIMAPRLAPDYFRCPKKSQPDTIFFCKQCGYTWVLFVLKEIQPFAFAQLGLFLNHPCLVNFWGVWLSSFWGSLQTLLHVVLVPCGCLQTKHICTSSSDAGLTENQAVRPSIERFTKYPAWTLSV